MFLGKIRVVGAVLLCAGLSGGFGADAFAGSLRDNLQSLLDEHPLVRSAQHQVDALKNQIGVAQSGYYPTLSVTGSTGRQVIDSKSSTDSALNSRQNALTLTQSIYNFGKTSTSIIKAEADLKRQKAELALLQQSLLFAGIEAHFGVIKAVVLLKHARASEKTVKEQTKLENARIESGRGYTTDLLQAKAQLAGAIALRISAKSEVSRAMSRYKSVFGDVPVDMTKFEFKLAPSSLLPTSLDDMVNLVLKSSPDILSTRNLVDAADADTDRVFANEWAPNVDLVADHSYKYNVDGVEKGKRDSSIMVEFSWDFYTGSRASNAVSAARNSASSQREQLQYIVRAAVEEATNRKSVV